MTAKVSNPMPEGIIRPKAPAAPPTKRVYGLMGEEMWNVKRCPSHDIEYRGCFCPECFKPKQGEQKKLGFSVEKFVEGLMVDVTPESMTLRPAMQELVDRWAGTPHGEFLFPRAGE